MSISLFCAALLVHTGVYAAEPSVDLPTYHARTAVAGTLRVSGNENMAGLLERWQRGFTKHHPGVQFAPRLLGTGSGIYGLEMRTADIALMSRAMHPFERYGTYERAWVFPVEIEVATGSLSTLGHSPAFAIFVHESNPLSALSMEQLDGIFGAQRGGGWQGLSWVEASGRPASADLRYWRQLGVRGSHANKPIHPYGPPLHGPGVSTFFQARVLQGGDLWNEDLREYDDRRQLIADLARDPLGIAYAPLAYAAPGVKALRIGERGGAMPVAPTRATLVDRSYPLARPVYVAYTIDDERSEIATPRVAPLVEEFLRYVLSREGQRDVEAEGSYVPLPSRVIEAQLQILSSEGIPPEKELLLK